MKLPFNRVISTILKPHLSTTRLLCQHPTFLGSIHYTYLYGILGFLLSGYHLKLHLGETPFKHEDSITIDWEKFILTHDLKIIATSMGVVQFACLLAGCITENPALFLPHLVGQLFLVAGEIINIFFLLAQINMKSLYRLRNKIPTIMLMIFNWLQEFCVFRKLLCICDL